MERQIFHTPGIRLQRWELGETLLYPLRSRESQLVRKTNEGTLRRKQKPTERTLGIPAGLQILGVGSSESPAMFSTLDSMRYPCLFITYAPHSGICLINWFLLITKRLLINESLWSDLIIYISSWQEVETMSYSIYWLLRQKIKEV